METVLRYALLRQTTPHTGETRFTHTETPGVGSLGNLLGDFWVIGDRLGTHLYHFLIFSRVLEGKSKQVCADDSFLEETKRLEGKSFNKNIVLPMSLSS